MITIGKAYDKKGQIIIVDSIENGIVWFRYEEDRLNVLEGMWFDEFVQAIAF